jgi:hypothetical protein
MLVPMKNITETLSVTSVLSPCVILRTSMWCKISSWTLCMVFGSDTSVASWIQQFPSQLLVHNSLPTLLLTLFLSPTCNIMPSVFFYLKKSSRKHSDTKFGQIGVCVCYTDPRKKVLKRHSGLHPSEKELTGHRSGVFCHTNTPVYATLFWSCI